MKIFTDELNQVRYRDEKGPCGDKGESVGLREIYRDLDFLTSEIEDEALKKKIKHYLDYLESLGSEF